MSRIGAGDFGWAADQARRAAEAAQAEARRLAELARAKTLAEAAPAALDPANAEGPRELGAVLGEAQSLAEAARASFTLQVARANTGGGDSAAVEAGKVVRALVDAACPPGSERREKLGQALLEFADKGVTGVRPKSLEAAVLQTLARLAPQAPPAGPAEAPPDALEREPRRPGEERPTRAGAAARSAPSTEVLPRGLPSAGDRTPVGRPSLPGADVRPAVLRERPVPLGEGVPRNEGSASDRQALVDALGAPPSIAMSGAAALPATRRDAESAGQWLAVRKVDWKKAAPVLLKARLQEAAGQMTTLSRTAEAIRNGLLDAQAGGIRVKVGLGQAAGFLEKAAFHAGVACELASLRSGPRESLRAMAAAREQVLGARLEAESAAATLSDFQGAGLRRALLEVRDIEGLARSAESELQQAQGQGALLEQMDAGAGLLAEGPAPSEAQVDEPGVFTEEDLKRIGTGLDPKKPPAQGVWTESMVNRVAELGRQQGGVTDADGARHFELAKVALGAEGADQGSAREMGAGDVAAVLKMAGIPLERVDPNQLQSAARYLNTATSLQDQQEKLRKTLDNFQVLGTIGAPRLGRQEIVEQLWAMAKVPGHALSKLSDAEVHKKFQEVAAALNGGPGPAQIKIGKHNLKLEIGEGGRVLKSSCKKPSFLSKVWKVVKTVAPYALMAASLVFTGGTAALIIKAAQAAISAVQAIKSKSILGIAAAGAALFGAGAGFFSKAGNVASRMANVASSVSRGLQGVSAVRSGNLLGGLASIGSAVAGGISSGIGKVGAGLKSFGEKLGDYSTKLSAVATGTQALRSYRAAGRAVDEARKMLAQAQASGGPRAVAEARQRLEQAESQKRTGLFGAASGAFQAASLFVRSEPSFPGLAKLAPAGGALEMIGRGLGVARDVSGKDYLSAAVGGLSLSASLDSRRRPDGSTFGDAARLAEASIGHYQSQKGLSAAEKAVEEAEARLRIAQSSGNPEAIQRAQDDVNRTRRGRESAVMGALGAAESLVQTGQSVAEARQQRPIEVALRRSVPTLEKGLATGKDLQALAGDATVPEPLRQAAGAESARLADASTSFQQAMIEAKGDPAREQAAKQRYEATLADIDASRQQIHLAVAAAKEPRARPAETSPGFASLRPQPSIGSVEIQNGMTLWEVSQRTGVPVERLRQFNREQGNPLVDEKLPIGGRILVPLGEEERAFTPRTAEEVRAQQRAARAARSGRAPSAGRPRLTADEVKAFTAIEEQLKKGDLETGTQGLQRLIDSGGPGGRELARSILVSIEHEHLRNVKDIAADQGAEIAAAVENGTRGVTARGMDLLGAVIFGPREPTHSDNIRAIGKERLDRLRDQSLGIDAALGLARATGLPLYEVSRMPPERIDEALRRANSKVDAAGIAQMRTSLLRSLGNADVKAIAGGQYSGGTFSWDRGKTGADVAFADSFLTDLSQEVGSGLRIARAEAESLKNSSSYWSRAAGHFVADSMDLTSSTRHVLVDHLDFAQQWWGAQGGALGKVGGTFAAVGAGLGTAVTAPLTVFDHRATTEERNRALVDTALWLGTGPLLKAGLPVAGRALSVLGRTPGVGRVVAPVLQGAAAVGRGAARIAATPLDDLVRTPSQFVLRQGTRAADALGQSAMGRTIRAANERVLAPIASIGTRSTSAFARGADMAKDYFHWANNVGKGQIRATGQELAEQASLAQLQAKHAAAKVYDGIRSSVDDVARIAKNTGIPESRIARIKDHVFHKLHQMDDGLRRFDPSPKIADAWKRLESGAHTADDVRLLQHELVESRFEGIFKSGYSTAHEASKEIARRATARAGGLDGIAAKRLIPGQPGVVTGGSSTALGRNMLRELGVPPQITTWRGYQAQHIVPVGLGQHPVIRRIGMDLDHASNGMFLPTPASTISPLSRHRGWHSTYSEVVRRQLNKLDPTRPVWQLQREVADLQRRLFRLAESGAPLYPSQGATVALLEKLLGKIK